jgi:hypothetical protein
MEKAKITLLKMDLSSRAISVPVTAQVCISLLFMAQLLLKSLSGLDTLVPQHFTSVRIL